MTVRNGHVCLVGAGPGDPELLTLRALRRLRAADIVFYDALVPPAVVDLAERAERVSVGKRVGYVGTPESVILGLLAREARRGRRVVRLKCGDPFVLGRGGEEALFLVRSGIPVEVVPGLSSALVAPCAIGAPVTHRGLASACLIVSGHCEEAYGPVLASLQPGCATLVVLMGWSRRVAIAATLLARGWAPETPAAVVWGASCPGGASWLGTLSSLGDAKASGCTAGLPATLVLGAVVGLVQYLGEPLRQGAASRASDAHAAKPRRPGPSPRPAPLEIR